MSNPVYVALAVVLLAAVAALSYALAAAWQRVMAEGETLPLHGMLKHQGLTVDEAAEELGVQALAYAARRCAFCINGAQCQRRLAAGEPAPLDCPNAGLFAGLTRPRA